MTRDDTSFLAPPGEIADWRRTVLTDAAATSGLLDALPGTPAEAADRADLDPQASRVLLEALEVWGIVESDGDDYRPGPATPDASEAAVLRHHARALARWSTQVPDRLAGAPRPDREPRSAEELATWLRALATNARRRAPDLVDRCLKRFPDTDRVLDLAGGHGEYGREFARRGLQVTLQDLPEVIDIVRGWPELADEPVTLVGADAFERVAPGPFDLVFCAGFTHTQPGGRIAGLLERLAGVTTSGGGIALHTMLRGTGDVARLFAVQMLLAGGGGDTHGADEYRDWLAAAGLEDVEIADVGGRSLILATRP